MIYCWVVVLLFAVLGAVLLQIDMTYKKKRERHLWGWTWMGIMGRMLTSFPVILILYETLL